VYFATKNIVTKNYHYQENRYT